MSLSAWFVVVIGSAAFALIIHELGHVLAAGALGGSGFRVVVAWPAMRVEAVLPEGKGAEVVFLLAGALANVGGAVALYGVKQASTVTLTAAVMQLVVAALSLVPMGHSDGSRLLTLWRQR